MYNLFKPNDDNYTPFDDDIKEREMMAKSLNFYMNEYIQVLDQQVNSLEYIQNKEKPINRLKSYINQGDVYKTVYDENIEDKNNNIVVKGELEGIMFLSFLKSLEELESENYQVTEKKEIFICKYLLYAGYNIIYEETDDKKGFILLTYLNEDITNNAVAETGDDGLPGHSVLGDNHIRAIYIGDTKGKAHFKEKYKTDLKDLEEYEKGINDEILKSNKDISDETKKKILVLHKLMYNFYNLNGTENKITVSKFFIKQLAENLNKKVKIKTLSNAIKHFFIYKTNIVTTEAGTTPDTSKISFKQRHRNIAVNSDNVSNYIVQLFSDRYNGAMEAKISEVETLKKIITGDVFRAMSVTNILQNRSRQFTTNDNKLKDITTAEQSDIFKLNTNMIHITHSVSRIHGLEETKESGTCCLVPGFENLDNGINFTDEDLVRELPNTINKDSSISILQALSIISLLKLVPQKVLTSDEVWKRAYQPQIGEEEYLIPNFDNIKFLSLKPNKYFTDIITTLQDSDHIKDDTNIKSNSELLKKYKYTNTSFSGMLDNFSDLYNIFYIQNINLNKKVDKVTITVHFSFVEGEDELDSSKLTEKSYISSLFSLKNNNNIVTKPAIKDIVKNENDNNYTMNMEINGKDKLNKSYQLIYKHGKFSEIKPSIDFYVDDKEANINITSHLKNNLWIIKEEISFPEQVIHNSDKRLITGVNFSNFNKSGKSVHVSSESHLILTTKNESDGTKYILEAGGDGLMLKLSDQLVMKKEAGEGSNEKVVWKDEIETANENEKNHYKIEKNDKMEYNYIKHLDHLKGVQILEGQVDHDEYQTNKLEIKKGDIILYKDELLIKLEGVGENKSMHNYYVLEILSIPSSESKAMSFKYAELDGNYAIGKNYEDTQGIISPDERQQDEMIQYYTFEKEIDLYLYQKIEDKKCYLYSQNNNTGLYDITDDVGHDKNTLELLQSHDFLPLLGSKQLQKEVEIVKNQNKILLFIDRDKSMWLLESSMLQQIEYEDPFPEEEEENAKLFDFSTNIRFTEIVIKSSLDSSSNNVKTTAKIEPMTEPRDISTTPAVFSFRLHAGDAYDLDLQKKYKKDNLKNGTTYHFKFNMDVLKNTQPHLEVKGGVRIKTIEWDSVKGIYEAVTNEKMEQKSGLTLLNITDRMINKCIAVFSTLDPNNSKNTTVGFTPDYILFISYISKNKDIIEISAVSHKEYLLKHSQGLLPNNFDYSQFIFGIESFQSEEIGNNNDYPPLYSYEDDGSEPIGFIYDSDRNGKPDAFITKEDTDTIQSNIGGKDISIFNMVEKGKNNVIDNFIYIEIDNHELNKLKEFKIFCKSLKVGKLLEDGVKEYESLLLFSDAKIKSLGGVDYVEAVSEPIIQNEIKKNPFITNVKINNFTNNQVIVLLELKKDIFSEGNLQQQKITFDYKLKYKKTTKVSKVGTEVVNIAKKDIMDISKIYFMDYGNSFNNQHTDIEFNNLFRYDVKNNYKLRFDKNDSIMSKLNINNFYLRISSKYIIPIDNKPIIPPTQTIIKSSDNIFEIPEDTIKNNREYDFSILYFIRDNNQDILKLFRKKIKVESQSLRGSTSDDYKLLLTQEPYSELFYDTVDAKVIKKTQDNVKDTTLSEKIKLIKTKEIRTEDNKGNVSIYLSQNCNPLYRYQYPSNDKVIYMEYPKNDDDEEEVVDIINIYDIYGIKEIYQQTPDDNIYQYIGTNNSYPDYKEEDDFKLEKSLLNTLTLSTETVKMKIDNTISMFASIKYRGIDYNLINDMKNIYHVSSLPVRSTLEKKPNYTSQPAEEPKVETADNRTDDEPEPAIEEQKSVGKLPLFSSGITQNKDFNTYELEFNKEGQISKINDLEAAYSNESCPSAYVSNTAKWNIKSKEPLKFYHKETVKNTKIGWETSLTNNENKPVVSQTQKPFWIITSFADYNTESYLLDTKTDSPPTNQWVNFYVNNQTSDIKAGNATSYNISEPTITTRLKKDIWNFDEVTLTNDILNDIKYGPVSQEGEEPTQQKYKVYFSGKSENIDYGIIRKATFDDTKINEEKLNQYGSTFYIVYDYKTAYNLWIDLTRDINENNTRIDLKLEWKEGEGTTSGQYFLKYENEEHYNPRLNLQLGYTYHITTPNNYPLRFTTGKSSDSFVSNIYENNITYSEVKTIIRVTQRTPKELMYYCKNDINVYGIARDRNIYLSMNPENNQYLLDDDINIHTNFNPSYRIHTAAALQGKAPDDITIENKSPSLNMNYTGVDETYKITFRGESKYNISLSEIPLGEYDKNVSDNKEYRENVIYNKENKTTLITITNTTPMPLYYYCNDPENPVINNMGNIAIRDNTNNSFYKQSLKPIKGVSNIYGDPYTSNITTKNSTDTFINYELNLDKKTPHDLVVTNKAEDKVLELIIGPIEVDLKLKMIEEPEGGAQKVAIETDYMDKIEDTDTSVKLNDPITLHMGYEYIFKLSDSYDPKENPKDNSLKTSLRDYNYEGDNNAPPGNKGLDFNITVNNTYAETLNENNELDKLHRIRSTIGDNNPNKNYKDIYSIKHGTYQLITDSTGGIWNKYVDLQANNDDFDGDDFSYNLYYNLYVYNSSDADVVDVIPRTWNEESDKKIKMSSELNTDPEVNYNHFIENKLFKNIGFDIEKYKRDEVSSSIKTLHNYNMYKGYDSLLFEIDITTAAEKSTDETILHLLDIFKIKKKQSNLILEFVSYKYGSFNRMGVPIAKRHTIQVGNDFFSPQGETIKATIYYNCSTSQLLITSKGENSEIFEEKYNKFHTEIGTLNYEAYKVENEDKVDNYFLGFHNIIIGKEMVNKEGQYILQNNFDGTINKISISTDDTEYQTNNVYLSLNDENMTPPNPTDVIGYSVSRSPEDTAVVNLDDVSYVNFEIKTLAGISSYNYLYKTENEDTNQNTIDEDNEVEKEKKREHQNENLSTQGLLNLLLSYDLGADKSITNAESIQFHYGNAVIQVQLDSLSFDKPNSYYMKWNVEPFKYRLIDRYPIKYEDETLRIKNYDNSYIDIDRDGLFDIRFQNNTLYFSNYDSIKLIEFGDGEGNNTTLKVPIRVDNDFILDNNCLYYKFALAMNNEDYVLNINIPKLKFTCTFKEDITNFNIQLIDINSLKNYAGINVPNIQESSIPDYGHLYNRIYKIENDTQEVRIPYTQEVRLPSSRYQLLIKNMLDETTIYPGDIEIVDYNNDKQTFNMDSNIKSLDKYIEQVIDITIEKKKINDEDENESEKYTLTDQNNYAAFYNDNNKLHLEKYNKLTVYNKEIKNLVSELKLFYDTYHNELYHVDTNYPVDINVYPNNFQAVIIFIDIIKEYYNSEYEIKIGDDIIITDNIISQDNLLNNFNDTHLPYSLKYIDGLLYIYYENQENDDHIIFTYEDYDFDSETSSSNSIVLKESTNEALTKHLVITDEDGYSIFGVISSITLNKLNLNKISLFIDQLMDGENVSTQHSISYSVYNMYVSMVSDIENYISDIWYDIWAGMYSLIMYPSLSIEELVAPFDLITGPSNIIKIIERLQILIEMKDVYYNVTDSDTHEFSKNYLGINNDIYDSGISIYSDTITYDNSAEDYEAQPISLSEHLLLKYENDSLQLLNDWSIIENSIPNNFTNNFDVVNNQIININDMPNLTFLVHNRIPKVNGTYYKASININKTNIEDLSQDLEINDETIEDKSSKNILLNSIELESNIFNIYGNGDIVVLSKNTDGSLKVKSKTIFDFGKDIKNIVHYTANSEIFIIVYGSSGYVRYKFNRNILQKQYSETTQIEDMKLMSHKGDNTLIVKKFEKELVVSKAQSPDISGVMSLPENVEKIKRIELISINSIEKGVQHLIMSVTNKNIYFTSVVVNIDSDGNETIQLYTKYLSFQSNIQQVIYNNIYNRLLVVNNNDVILYDITKKGDLVASQNETEAFTLEASYNSNPDVNVDKGIISKVVWEEDKIFILYQDNENYVLVLTLSDTVQATITRNNLKAPNDKLVKEVYRGLYLLENSGDIIRQSLPENDTVPIYQSENEEYLTQISFVGDFMVVANQHNLVILRDNNVIEKHMVVANQHNLVILDKDNNVKEEQSVTEYLSDGTVKNNYRYRLFELNDSTIMVSYENMYYLIGINDQSELYSSEKYFNKNLDSLTGAAEEEKQIQTGYVIDFAMINTEFLNNTVYPYTIELDEFALGRVNTALSHRLVDSSQPTTFTQLTNSDDVEISNNGFVYLNESATTKEYLKVGVKAQTGDLDSGESNIHIIKKQSLSLEENSNFNTVFDKDTIVHTVNAESNTFSNNLKETELFNGIISRLELNGKNNLDGNYYINHLGKKEIKQINNPNTNPDNYYLLDDGFKVVPKTNLVGNDIEKTLTINIILLAGFISEWEFGTPIVIKISNDNGDILPLENITTEKYRSDNLQIVNNQIVWEKSAEDDISNIQRKWSIQLPKGDIYKIEILNLTQTWNEGWGVYEEAEISFELDNETIIPHWKHFYNDITHIYDFIHCEGVDVQIDLNPYYGTLVDDISKLTILNYNKYTNLLEKVSRNNTTVATTDSIQLSCSIPRINKIMFGIKKEIVVSRQEVEYYELHKEILELSLNTGETGYEYSFIGSEMTSSLIRDKRVYDNYLFEISGNKLSLNIAEALQSRVFQKNRLRNQVYILKIRAKYQFEVIDMVIPLLIKSMKWRGFGNLNLTILPDIYSSETTWLLETTEDNKDTLLSDVKQNIEVIDINNSEESYAYSLDSLGSTATDLKGLDFEDNTDAIEYHMNDDPVQNTLEITDEGYLFDKLSVWSIPLKMGKTYTLTINDLYNDGIARPGYITVLLDDKHLVDSEGVVVDNNYKYYQSTKITIDLTQDVNSRLLLKSKLAEANENLEIILPKLKKLNDKEVREGSLDEVDSNNKTFLTQLKTDLLKLRIGPINKNK